MSLAWQNHAIQNKKVYYGLWCTGTKMWNTKLILVFVKQVVSWSLDKIWSILYNFWKFYNEFSKKWFVTRVTSLAWHFGCLTLQQARPFKYVFCVFELTSYFVENRSDYKNEFFFENLLMYNVLCSAFRPMVEAELR